MTDSAPSMQTKAVALGMQEAEYDRVLEILGREPTETELAMFSVEWSEHCGYPRSRPLLELLPKSGKCDPLVGEDAGGIRLTPEIAIVFKMESHNHPSQVEPKHGAATGVGGIIRDIFTCGARPIACLDALRFGDLSDPKARYLFAGVVDGIQFYGNCIGVPTVAGEVGFNPCYRGNCLVGVMAVGVVRADAIASGIAQGPGNRVLYIGNSTGRDGIGGCSVLASHELGAELEMRPTVQIGDPFTEKCLIEACLEALETGAIISMKDMGAAGLTCTTCEQAAAGGVGMDIDIGLTPLREADMEPFEIMMSESQERMLAVVDKNRVEEVRAVFTKWGCQTVDIGEITDDGLMRVRHHGRVVAEMPAAALADPPTYHLPAEEPAYLSETRAFEPHSLDDIEDGNHALLQLLASPSIASKSWVYEQYDHMVQTNTLLAPGAGDAAVLRIKEAAPRGIAVTADCNSRYVYLDPRRGAMLAVAEAARNLSCVGAEPAAVTDCLCFGNPEKPDRFYQFSEAVHGLRQACEFFELAVVSGNVSFYNETTESVIHPTPLIGMVGVLENVARHVGMSFAREGDIILLVGETGEDLGGSEYLWLAHGLETGQPPQLDLERERAVQEACRRGIREGFIKSAHDCSEGGLAICLAECCFAHDLGAEVILPRGDLRRDEVLFGETASRIIVTVSPQADEDAVLTLQTHGCTVQRLGEVGGDRLRIEYNDATLVDQPVADLKSAWRDAIPCLMG